MKWMFLCLAGLGTAAFLVLGCSAPQPRPEVREPERPLFAPSGLHVDHQPFSLTLTWQTNRRVGDAISGYHIYLSPEKSIRDLAPDSPEAQAYLWQFAVYPGDTDPRTDIETAMIDAVEYGVEYHIYVRTVGADGRVSPPSEEIRVIPRPSGRIELVPRHVDRRDGFSFAESDYVRAQDERNDLYLFVRNDSVFAASPHRLERSNRHVEFHELGPAVSVEDYPTVDIARKGKDFIHLQQGFAYILSTPENCPAKLFVAGIAGSAGQTVVTVDYVFQTRSGVGIF
jgi:hypothetical protein